MQQRTHLAGTFIDLGLIAAMAAIADAMEPDIRAISLGQGQPPRCRRGKGHGFKQHARAQAKANARRRRK